jgi:hypothetical protein
MIMANWLSAALIGQIMFWTMIILSFLIVFGIALFFLWKKGFNIAVWVVEKRGDGVSYWRTKRAKRFTDMDGNVKYVLFQMNPFAKSSYIKPTDDIRDVYRIEGKDAILVSKNSKDEYCPIHYNYDENSFENIPAEVSYWASNTRNHRMAIHKKGINWALIGAIGIVTFALIISLVMVIMTLGYASSVQCVGGQAVTGSNWTIPLVGK